MGKVQMLPETLINKIAAGEVVDRPASAVKELIENAIDAGATRIDVDIERGGKKLIRLADNGSGMTREDAQMALQRHATSKLRNENDLFQIMTMGFRGEALPSIASVSRFKLLTRTEDDPEGTLLEIDGGEDPQIVAAGRAQGTTVEIADLFFNLPGRKKFLKADGTEFSHIAEVVTRLSLANPHIRFRLTHNKRVQLQAPATDELKERIASVLGRQVGQHMHPVELKTGWLQLEGVFSEPTTTTQGTKGIYLFVNGRFIKDRGLAHACQEAYRGTIEKGRYPYIVMFLEVDPSEVDVNVHPQKIEVRFQRQHEVYSRLLTTLRSAVAKTPWLTSNRLATTNEAQAANGTAASHDPTLTPPTKADPLAPPPMDNTQPTEAGHPQVASAPKAPASPAAPSAHSAPRNFEEFRSRFMQAASDQIQSSPLKEVNPNEALPPLPTAQEGLPFLPGWDPPTGKGTPAANPPANGTHSPTPQKASEALPVTSAAAFAETQESPADIETASPTPIEPMGFFSSLQYIGQFAQMYLIFEAKGHLVVIDQHAAHERISYQKLLEAFEKASIPQQSFLIPPRLELSLTTAQQAEEHIEKLAQLGVVIEPFGGQSFIVKALPAILKDADPYSLLNDLLEELASGRKTASLDEKRDEILMRMACHGSVRGCHRLSADEVRALQRQLDSIDFKGNCPHGRPVYFELPQKEIEKRFHRT